MSDFIRRDCVASERNKGNHIPEEKHVGKLKLSCSRKLKKKATSCVPQNRSCGFITKW